MTKLNKLAIAALFATAFTAAYATDNRPTVICLACGGSGGSLSTVNVNGSTSASATGGNVTAYGRTSVDGVHVGPNGSTHFIGDTGAEGKGVGSANAQTGLTYGEVRQTSSGGLRMMYPMDNSRMTIGGRGANTSSVNNFGAMISDAHASGDTQAWGDMSQSGNLTGPRGSNLTFDQSHGYSSVGTGHSAGQSSGYYGAEFRTTIGRRP